MSALLHALLAKPVPTGLGGAHGAPEPQDRSGLAAFRAAWIPADPFEAAVVGGLTADRLGYAFAAGYASALRRLVPTLDQATSACLCVTEAGGAQHIALGGATRWRTLSGPGNRTG